MLLLASAHTAYASYDVSINNDPVKLDYNTGVAEAIGDTVYLPVRKLAEANGGSVGWSDGCTTVTAGENVTKLWGGQAFAHVNGTQVWLSHPIRIDDGHTMISIEDTSVIGLYKDITQPWSGVNLHRKFYGASDRFFNIVTTISGDPHTTRAFAWEAMPEYRDMVIEYGVRGSGVLWRGTAAYTESAVSFAYNTIAGVSQRIYNAEYVSEMENMLFYKAELTSLVPGTTYSYRVGDPVRGEWSEFFTFTTEAENTNEFSVIGVTDPQGRTRGEYSYYRKTLYTALSDDPNAAFVINMGDLTDNANYDDWWRYFFEAGIGIQERLPQITVVGNHENRGAGAKYYNLRFMNPKNGSGLASWYVSDGNDKRSWPIIQNLDNTVYSFDYGNAHFSVLNTGTDWSALEMRTMLEWQRDWLDSDLSSTDKEWKIVLVHIGVYLQKPRESLVKAIFEDTIDRHGVDLVLEGHDHTYMRTFQMRAGAAVSDERMYYKKGGGALYAILGSAALKRYNSDTPQPYAAVMRNIPDEEPSYTILSFDPAKISVISKLTDGSVIDEFSIWK